MGDRPFDAFDRLYFSALVYTRGEALAHPEWVIEFVESIFSIADPFEADLGLVAFTRPKFQEIRKKFTEASWKWCKGEIQQGRLLSVLTYPRKPIATHVVPVWTVDMEELAEVLAKKIKYQDPPNPFQMLKPPTRFLAVAEVPLSWPRIDDGLQSKMTALARATLLRTNGVYGFVNSSRRQVESPTEYEQRHKADVLSSEWFIDRKVRGGFWENYLTSGHIERLGGVAAIREKAPCAQVEEVTPGRIVLLRLSNDVNSVTAEQVRNLEEYLEPLAPVRVG